MPLTRKLRVPSITTWSHHCGGWNWVMQVLGRHFHADDGTLCLPAVEEIMVQGTTIREPWVGFVHQAPRTSYAYPDLYRLLKLSAWQQSIENCRGLWVLSWYVKDFLRAWNVDVSIARLLYPTPEPDALFDPHQFRETRRVVMAGKFLRNVQAFYDLSANGFRKLMLNLSETNPHLRGVRRNDSVEVVERVSDDEYARLLESSVVFLSLFDAVAVTTLTECIARGTPVLVNPVGGAVEYLGADYPLYYRTLEEATAILHDEDRLAAGSQYLLSSPTRQKLTGEEAFIQSFAGSAPYRRLPVPRSSRSVEFRKYDATLCICSYNRVEFLPELMARLVDQDYDGTYEVILWNNNIARASEVDDAVSSVKRELNLTVIHSTQNYYCIIRMAMPQIMRSETLIICDDDVLPAPNYVATLMEKHRDFGEWVALCARGHAFLPHTLDEEEPDRVWSQGEHLKFVDERAPDQPIHFMHADNCVISRTLLRKAAAYEMDHDEFALVDDYWLSYVLQAKLNTKIWKVCLDGCISFIESANDPDVALYLNPKVHEQRVNFYTYHMSHGWPNFETDHGTSNQRQ